MNNGLTVELIGYVASGLVAVSMLMVSIVRLRVINLVGAVAFTVYGCMLPSIPIVITNVFIIVVNVVQLTKTMRQGRSACAYIDADQGRSIQLAEYVKIHHADIARYAPHFAVEYLNEAWSKAGRVYIAFHQSRIRGIAALLPIWKLDLSAFPNYAGLRPAIEHVLKADDSEKTLFLVIDYVDSRYRDLGLAEKLFDRFAELSADGWKRIVMVSPSSNGRSRKYLLHHGFVSSGSWSGLDLYGKELPVKV